MRREGFLAVRFHDPTVETQLPLGVTTILRSSIIHRSCDELPNASGLCGLDRHYQIT